MEEVTNAPLYRFTTLKIGGEAGRLCNPSSIEETIELLDRLRKTGEPWHVIGGGSNLLVSSEGVEGTVIRTALITEIKQLDDTLIEAGAGARLPHLAKHAAKLGLSGLEFAVGIPGTVGGAVVMNAGAHGSCTANILESVTVFDTKKWQLVTLSNADLNFAYRKSEIDPESQIVLSARFRLPKGEAAAIIEQTQHNEDYRWKTQPLSWPNGGSTFTNPLPDKTAGYLLEQAGAKEFREGAAAVSEIHANFIINLGGATSKEVTNLLTRMQDSVYNKFNIRLHPEWKRLGKFTKQELGIWNGTH